METNDNEERILLLELLIEKQATIIGLKEMIIHKTAAELRELKEWQQRQQKAHFLTICNN